MQLSREAPDPLYLQLKDTLVAEIKAGHYLVHQRLPSERELSERYKVSRMTARQALLDLARDGLVYTRVGKGTFVAELKIDQQLRTVTGFSQDIRARGSQPSSVVLEAKVIPATPEVAAALRLLAGAEVIALARVRLADGNPLAVETAYLPFMLCPNLLHHDFSIESLYSILEKEYGFLLTQADQTIEAALATPQEAELLKLTPPAAMLHMERLTVRQDGQPIEYVLSTYRGDRYKFCSQLQPRSKSR
jgi:GntR family transcriptional regulator